VRISLVLQKIFEVDEVSLFLPWAALTSFFFSLLLSLDILQSINVDRAEKKQWKYLCFMNVTDLPRSFGIKTARNG
jgi:hypothetical protein